MAEIVFDHVPVLAEQVLASFAELSGLLALQPDGEAVLLDCTPVS